MRREAKCACGQVTAKVSGEPYAVVMCHCRACQRRSGSPYGVSAYFLRDQVELSGTTKAFVRPGASGTDLQNYFCPDCGTTVYWLTELHADGMGIAYGLFEDATLSAPGRSVWETSRHDWVPVAAETRYLMGSAGPKVPS
ncbi:MAG: GFA family protein [Pacificimonas sp.]